tara:strand:+ start:3018 stop:3872 length:855 start_codon:yes stop_codon:yes gene_type:complete
MNITPEEMEKLMKLFPQEDLDKIMEMAEIEDEGVIPVPSKSMSTEQYAKSREASMFERMPLEETEVESIPLDEEDIENFPLEEVEVEEVEDEGDESLDIIMYSDFIEGEEESEEKSSSQYYSGDEENSQIEILKELENGVKKGFKNGIWKPHASYEGGNDTVAYGHKITDEERDAGTFDDGITDEEAVELLKKDIDEANRKIRVEINDFDSFPYYLRQELVNSTYRNLLNKSPDTLTLINKGDFEGAAVEFINKVDNYKTNTGIRDRMDRVVDALNRYAQELDD